MKQPDKSDPSAVKCPAEPDISAFKTAECPAAGIKIGEIQLSPAAMPDKRDPSGSKCPAEPDISVFKTAECPAAGWCQSLKSRERIIDYG